MSPTTLETARESDGVEPPCRSSGSADVMSNTPASTTDDVDALAVGTSRTISHQYDVTCTTPGVHSVVFTTTVAPEKAKVVDAVPGNNNRSATYTVDCAVPVVLNVEPGSLKNPVQLDMGLVPMAVLSTAAGEYGLPLAFDVRKIQASTVRIGQRTGLNPAANTGAPEAHGEFAPRGLLGRRRGDPRRRSRHVAARPRQVHPAHDRDHRDLCQGQVRARRGDLVPRVRRGDARAVARWADRPATTESRRRGPRPNGRGPSSGGCPRLEDRCPLASSWLPFRPRRATAYEFNDHEGGEAFHRGQQLDWLASTLAR